MTDREQILGAIEEFEAAPLTLPQTLVQLTAGKSQLLSRARAILSLPRHPDRCIMAIVRNHLGDRQSGAASC